jgi:hypothetical protein
MVGVGSPFAPSPQWGEGWGEGARRQTLIADAAHPHPALSLQGEGKSLGPIAGDEEFVADLFEDRLGASQDIVGPEAQDAVAVVLDDVGARRIAFGFVLPSVQLDGEAGGAAGEVGDIAVDLELADEFLAFEAAGAEVVSEAFLGFRLIIPQAAGDRSQSLSSHRRTPSPNPLPHGERAFQPSFP